MAFKKKNNITYQNHYKAQQIAVLSVIFDDRPANIEEFMKCIYFFVLFEQFPNFRLFGAFFIKIKLNYSVDTLETLFTAFNPKKATHLNEVEQFHLKQNSFLWKNINIHLKHLLLQIFNSLFTFLSKISTFQYFKNISIQIHYLQIFLQGKSNQKNLYLINWYLCLFQQKQLHHQKFMNNMKKKFMKQFPLQIKQAKQKIQKYFWGMIQIQKQQRLFAQGYIRGGKYRNGLYLQIYLYQLKMLNNRTKKNKNKIPMFIRKLYSMLQDPNSQGVIQWNKHNKGFGVIDQQKFLNIVLPKYYKLSNVSSFTRQLNMYGFRKIWSGSFQFCYQHQFFIKSKLNLLAKIKRNKQKKSITWEDDSVSQVQDFEELVKLNKKASQLTRWCLEKIKKNQTLFAEIQNNMEDKVASIYNAQFITQLQNNFIFRDQLYNVDQAEANQSQNSVQLIEEKDGKIQQDELFEKLLRSQTSIQNNLLQSGTIKIEFS